jgi:small subunit ribosomal protein S8e
MKRKFELGRQPANTKIGEKKVSRVRVRGGAFKYRALRLDAGNFSWTSEAVTRKTRLLNVVYNATSNEYVRTNTLVKGAVLQIDATPFKQWYLQHYNVQVGKKDAAAATGADAAGPAKQSRNVKAKVAKRNTSRKLDPALDEQFVTGRLYARIGSRPGQSGRADGYILEGEELKFYLHKLNVKKRK